MPIDAKIIELVKGNDSALISLELSHSEINDEDAKAIALALKENFTITKINLSNNKIHDEGAQAIGSALAKNHTLTYLNLLQNPINPPVREKIASIIKRNCQLRNDHETVRQTFLFDLNKKIVKLNTKDKPTAIDKKEVEWLYARNNKYAQKTIDPAKVGKWMLFYSSEQADEMWEKVKKEIQDGNLWDAKVSTKNPHQSTHAMMIYTKDYTDIKDIIRVLDHLETSGIKPEKTVIRYKTDAQTRAGVYSGGTKRPSLYSSDYIYKHHVNKRYTTRSDAPFWRSTAITSNSNSNVKITTNEASTETQATITDETPNFVAYYLTLKNSK